MTNEEIAQLKRRLIENLAEPEEVQTDSGRIKRQSVSQQIKALDYLETAETRSKGSQVSRLGVYKLRNKD